MMRMCLTTESECFFSPLRLHRMEVRVNVDLVSCVPLSYYCLLVLFYSDIKHRQHYEKDNVNLDVS